MSLIKLNARRPSVNPFESIFNDFFEGEFFPQAAPEGRRGTLPAANIKETEGAYHVQLAAPGMKKEDFKLELNEDLLTIRSESKQVNEQKKERFTKREFNYTAFVRSFRLPEEVDAEKITASYQDGILNIEIPKVEVKHESKVREIAIK